MSKAPSVQARDRCWLNLFRGGFVVWRIGSSDLFLVQIDQINTHYRRALLLISIIITILHNGMKSVLGRQRCLVIPSYVDGRSRLPSLLQAKRLIRSTPGAKANINANSLPNTSQKASIKLCWRPNLAAVTRSKSVKTSPSNLILRYFILSSVTTPAKPP
ncbi:hypothetical protein B0T19DRAFT_227175 [Cercophora scortea]|uniref:Uncharacterized protein n=1 Tax=Cercophora scortea TaxID=314031 RepID=A0AAE0M9U8_9PEZI|nr:hypothetical protein B0T19DRAFT_227175 [Cercophora scortea]